MKYNISKISNIKNIVNQGRVGRGRLELLLMILIGSCIDLNRLCNFNVLKKESVIVLELSMYIL